MNILLVYPSTFDDSDRVRKYKRGQLPPVSLAVLHALTPAHHRVHIVNDLLEEIDFEGAYDLVGISAMTPQVMRAYQIADRFRGRGTKVVIGGMHATVLPEEVKEHADAVVIGEAENLWETVLDDCEQNQLKDYYKNTSYPDLKKLVIPRFDHMNLGLYLKPLTSKLPIIPIYATRGCIYNCKFCSVAKYFGKAYRFKPIEHVLQEIDTIGAKRYFFVDDNIICDRDYSQSLFRELKKKQVNWISQGSTSMLKHPDLIEQAAQSGCTLMLLGVESINRKNLRSVNKGFNKVEKYEELFSRLIRSGISPLVMVIFGFDEDTRESIEETVAFLNKCKVGTALFCILTPLPGTDLYDEMKRENRILHQDWNKYDMTHVVFKTKVMTSKELLDSYWRAFQSFYSTQNILKHSAHQLVMARKTFLRNPQTRVSSYMASLLFRFACQYKVKGFDHPLTGGVNI